MLCKVIIVHGSGFGKLRLRLIHMFCQYALSIFLYAISSQFWNTSLLFSNNYSNSNNHLKNTTSHSFSNTYELCMFVCT